MVADSSSSACEGSAACSELSLVHAASGLEYGHNSREIRRQ